MPGWSATVVDIALAFALIPSLDAVGAAIANGAAILVAGVPCLVLAARLHLPDRSPGRPAPAHGRLALAVAGASGAVLLALGTGTLATLLGVIAGTLAFFAFAALLRPLAAEDAAWLAGALGGSGARGTAAWFATRIGAMIDLHCHLLPGLDDGPASEEGSIALAAEIAASG